MYCGEVFGHAVICHLSHKPDLKQQLATTKSYYCLFRERHPIIKPSNTVTHMKLLSGLLDGCSGHGFRLNSCWLFQAHSNGACLIQPLDSATDTTVGKSEQLSIDLKECITDLTKPGTSPGAISKQWQVLNQQYVSISAWPSCVTAHDQEENTNYHLLLREHWSGWSTKKHQKAS